MQQRNRVNKADYEATSEATLMEGGGYQPKIVHSNTLRTAYVGRQVFKTDAEAVEYAQQVLDRKKPGFWY